MQNDVPHSELLRLAANMCDGNIDHESRMQLEQMLKSDSGLRQLFIDYVHVHAALTRHWRGEGHGEDLILEHVRRESPISPLLDLVNDAESDQATAQEQDDQAVPKINEVPSPHYSPSKPRENATHPVRTRSWLDKISKHPVPPAIVAAIVVLSVVLTWAALTILPGVAKNEQAPDKAEFIAKLIDWHGVDGHEVEWLDGTKPTATRSRLESGQRLAIASGLLEIRYYTGAKVVIEGPAVFVVGGKSGNNTEYSVPSTQDSNSGYLALGKLTARCETEASHGFTIGTPTALVEDLGTEFALAVNKSGRSDVHVFAGSVRLDAQQDGVRTASLLLGANQTARVDADSPGVVPLAATEQAQQFAPYRKFSELASADYAERVLALKPVAYWRMEEANGLEVANAASAAQQGLARVPDAAHIPWTTGKFGSALRLRGTGSGDDAIVRDYPATTTGKLTVAAWVRAESRPTWAVLAANWGQWKTGQFLFCLRTEDGDLSAQITQANGRLLSAREGADHPFPLGRWQHVALVADGQRVRLYRQGTEVANVPYDGTLLAVPPPSMSIGCKLSDDGKTSVGMNWNGSIDELVLLHRALSAAEIRELASAQ